MLLSKSERLALFFNRLEQAKPATSIIEARNLIDLILTQIEDEFSEIENNPYAETSKRDGRLYPPQDDSCIIINDKGDLLCLSRYELVYFGRNGSILIEQRSNGKVVLNKKGADNRRFNE